MEYSILLLISKQTVEHFTQPYKLVAGIFHQNAPSLGPALKAIFTTMMREKKLGKKRWRA